MPTHRAMVRMSRSSSTCVIAIPSCSSSWRWGRLQTIDNLDMTTHFLVSLRLQSTQIIQKLIPVGQREYARPEIQFLPRPPLREQQCALLVDEHGINERRVGRDSLHIVHETSCKALPEPALHRCCQRTKPKAPTANDRPSPV